MIPSNPTPDEETVESWCRQASAGDLTALERLLTVHHQPLLGFALRKVGLEWRGRIDPEDLLQQAYIDIFESIGRFIYAGPDSFYHWAARIVAHRFSYQVRYWRTQRRDKSRESPKAALSGSRYQTLLQRCLADSATPSRAAQRAEAASALMSGIARLPENYRRVVQRLYLNEETLSAVAADMGRSEDAVRRLAGRAVKRLREALEMYRDNP